MRNSCILREIKTNKMVALEVAWAISARFYSQNLL